MQTNADLEDHVESSVLTIEEFTSPMLLKFPHVRLFMRNMLAEGMSCSDAIANAAYEYGLITKEAVERVRSMPLNGTCPCMVAARQVLVENFASSAKAEKLKPQIDNVWSTILGRTNKNVDGAHECNGSDHHCDLAAPALFDILLQELSRY